MLAKDLDDLSEIFEKDLEPEEIEALMDRACKEQKSMRELLRESMTEQEYNDDPFEDEPDEWEPDEEDE
jgi:hypothetical protein